MTPKKLSLFLIIHLLTGFILVKAQAYDGSIDTKVFLGYTNTGGKPGAEFRYENGINDFFSIGTDYICLLYKSGSKSYLEEKIELFIQRSDFGLYVNYHIFQNKITSSRVDPYVGAFVSFKSLGLQAGVKYNFSERLGLYGQFNQSFGNSFFGIGGTPDDFVNHFGKKASVAAGITYNFL